MSKYYDYRDGQFRYRTGSKPIHKTWAFLILVLGVLQALQPLVFGAGKSTVIQSQLGIISEQECVERLTEELGAIHAVPCGSLLRVMGEAFGDVESKVERDAKKAREANRKLWKGSKPISQDPFH